MKSTVYVERITMTKYRVVRVRNSTEPEVGVVLLKGDVDRMVKDGVEVIVDLPRKRE